MMDQACNFRTQNAEEGRSMVQGQPELQRPFQKKQIIKGEITI